IDADALVLLSQLAGGGPQRPVVCTPHLGEFRALFGDQLADAAANDRWAAVAKAAQKIKGTVLLKGVPTVVADLRGPIHVVASGNPGLATGGSGDLLAGFIGAFLARGGAAPEAAALGAHALGRAAEAGTRHARSEERCEPGRRALPYRVAVGPGDRGAGGSRGTLRSRGGRSEAAGSPGVARITSGTGDEGRGTGGSRGGDHARR